MQKFFKKVSGVTLIEILVGAGIFTVLMSMSASTAYLLYGAKNKIERTNELYTETRFVMDRIVREVRVNTIDYYEYFSHNIDEYSAALRGSLTESPIDEYGNNPGLYEMFFKLLPNASEDKNVVSHNDFSWDTVDRAQDFDMGVFNTGADSNAGNDDEEYSALDGNHEQEELYLLSSDGLSKTIIKRVEETILGNTVGRIVMLQMTLIDDDGDGVEETWAYNSEFTGGTPIPITPPTINVTNLDLYVSPLDDPYKAFAKSVTDAGVNPHIQPHVLIRISAKISEHKFAGLRGENNEFSLQTAATSRVLTNVTFPKP